MVENKGWLNTVGLLLSMSVVVGFGYMALVTFLYWARLNLPVSFFWTFWLGVWVIGGLVGIATLASLAFQWVADWVRGRTSAE